MAIGALTEEVAENLEEAAEITRRIDTRAVGILLGGICIGAAVGFYFGYRFNKEKIKAEAYKNSEEEVDKIREIYQQKLLATQSKPSIEEVIEERGYTQVITEEERPLKPPVPVAAPPVVVYESGKSKDENWHYPVELSSRSVEFPYVIHQDEFKNKESGYNHVTYTYYAEDDVLVDEDEHPLPHADLIVGQNNLKFGHGTDDIDVVFVRNDKLELEMEICRIPKSYEQEVLGLEHTYSSERMRKRRNRFENDDSDPN